MLLSPIPPREVLRSADILALISGITDSWTIRVSEVNEKMLFMKWYQIDLQLIVMRSAISLQPSQDGIYLSSRTLKLYNPTTLLFW